MNNYKEEYNPNPFIKTKEYLKFDEFAQSCAKYKYIGICHGSPGVGKTYTALEYTQPQILSFYSYNDPLTNKLKNHFKKCKGAFITVPVSNTPKLIRQKTRSVIYDYGHAAQRLKGIEDVGTLIMDAEKKCPLLIVDEADRLNFTSLEELRAVYDETSVGLILLGMPGIEKRLSRYAQLYSRIGFVHEFKPLSKEEMRFLFEEKWNELGRQFDKNTFLDIEAMNEIIKITNGNFRLITRIFDQMQRIMEINKITNLSRELVEAARNCLVIGDFL